MTNVEKVLEEYTCPMFNAVYEPVYSARALMTQLYGEVAAVRAIIYRDRVPPESITGDNHE